jgi:hypothetical protein
MMMACVREGKMKARVGGRSLQLEMPTTKAREAHWMAEQSPVTQTSQIVRN